MRLKKSRMTAEEELRSLINEGYELLLGIRTDYQKKTRDEKILRSVEIDQTYQARINPWIDKVGVVLNSIFPTSIEANSFILSSGPPELIDSQRKLEYSYQYLRLEVLNKALKTILDGGLEQYTDLLLVDN